MAYLDAQNVERFLLIADLHNFNNGWSENFAVSEKARSAAPSSMICPHQNLCRKLWPQLIQHFCRYSYRSWDKLVSVIRQEEVDIKSTYAHRRVAFLMSNENLERKMFRSPFHFRHLVSSETFLEA